MFAKSFGRFADCWAVVVRLAEMVCRLLAAVCSGVLIDEMLFAMLLNGDSPIKEMPANVWPMLDTWLAAE